MSEIEFPEFMDAAAAATYMYEQSREGSVKYWRQRMNNLRRTDRPQPFVLGFAKVEGKKGLYRFTDLVEFLQFEKTRIIGKLKLTGRAAQVMVAFGIGKKGGSTTGRKFGNPHITPQVDESTGKRFAQLILSDPLMVFRLEHEELRSFTLKLVEILSQLDRVTPARAGKKMFDMEEEATTSTQSPATPTSDGIASGGSDK